MEMPEDATTLLLLHAATEGDVKCVRELLEADDNSSLPAYKALLLATEHGHERLVRFLLGRGADVNTVADDGRTVLEMAAANGYRDVVIALIEFGADVSDAGSQVWTPLVLAVENGHEETARCLVEVGADVNSTDYAGRPMLSVAVDMEQTEMVNYLVSNGAGVLMPEHTILESKPSQTAKQPSCDLMPQPKWRLTRSDVEVCRAEYLGGSRSGRVYRGKWLKSQVVVRELAVDSKQMDGFKREARSWFRLSHPNVLRLYGVGCDADTPPAFVCEFAPYGSLDGFLKTHPDQLWSKLYEVALGVQHLHDRGVALGDITCSNVVIGTDMKAKIAGFRRRHLLADTKRRAEAVRWLNDEFRSDASAHPTLKSDMIALGLCVLEAVQIAKAAVVVDQEAFVFVSMDEDSEQQSDRGICTDDQWRLIEGMCARDPRRRLNIGDVVRALEQMQRTPSDQHQPEHTFAKNLDTYNDGELTKRWGEAQRLMMDHALQGLQRRVFVDLLSIFARLQQDDQPTWVLEQTTLLLDDFLRSDRFLRCRVLNPAALNLTSSMRVFGQRITDMLGWVGLDKAHAASSDFSYPQIDFLVSEDQPTWVLLTAVTSDVDYETLHSLIKGELFGNSASYTFDQLVVLRSAVEEIHEAALLNQTESLELRPRWLIPHSELLIVGQRAKWQGADVMVSRVKRRPQDTEAAAETTEVLRDMVDVWFALSQPNILRLYGACHVGDPFFVCEDAASGLNEYLGEHPSELWAKLQDAARGLQCLHDQGIVHGNLRSSSIVIAADGLAKLTDIGLGTVVGEGGDVSDWRWEAPECGYQKDKTPEMDVFSFGVCVAEALRVARTPMKDVEDKEREEQVLSSLLLDGDLDAFLAATSMPVRPKLCRDDEWELVQSMSAYNPSDRMEMSAVVEAMEKLARIREDVKSETGEEKQPTGGSHKWIQVDERFATALEEDETKCSVGEL